MGDLNLVRAVGLARLRSVVISRNARTEWSRYCDATVRITPPSENMERAAGELVELGRSFRSHPVLFYSNDAQLLMVSRFRDRLSPWYRFRLPDAELVESLVDKSRFSDLAEQAGLPIPRSLRLESGAPPTPPWGFPSVLKPASRLGWFESGLTRGAGYKAIRVDSQEELEAWVEKVRRHDLACIVQEFIPGGDDQIFSFHGYLDQNSTPLAWFVGRKVRSYPLDTGRSSCLRLVNEPEVATLGLSALQRLAFRGIVKVDIKRDIRSARYYILEINPRFNLWHYLGAVSGVNLPGAAYAEQTGTPRAIAPDYSTRFRWYNVPRDLKASWHAIGRGRLSVPDLIRSYKGRPIFDLLSASDPMPVVFVILDDIGRAFRRVVRFAGKLMRLPTMRRLGL